MQISEVRELKEDELAKELQNQELALMNLRFRSATMQLSDFSEIRKTRQTVARIRTVIREREIVAEMNSSEGQVE
jgi:large subunit ribosomal protein L29